MRIVDARNKRALERVFARDGAADRAFTRRVAAIVDRVRQDGDRALLRFARRFDDARPPIEVSAREMIAEAERVPVGVRRAVQRAARNIAKVAARQVPKSFAVAVEDAEAEAEKALVAAMLRAGWTVSTPLFVVDDGHPGAGGRRR